jgi:thiol-disulfide isomerase/thioredoxin
MSLTKTLLIFCVATVALAAPAQLKTGDAFPDLTKFKLEGQLPASLAGKVVIVDFWASWCSPCKASFPVLNELQKTYGDKVVVIGVNVDEKRAEMDGFLKQHAADFTVVRDADKQLVAIANINTMPTSFVLDATGKVRSIHNGFHGDTTKKQYVAEIDELLKAK